MVSAPKPISIYNPFIEIVFGSIKKPFPPYTSNLPVSPSTSIIAVNASIDVIPFFSGELTSFTIPLLSTCFTTKPTLPILYNAFWLSSNKVSGESITVFPVAILIYSVESVEMKVRPVPESEIFISVSAV